MMVITVTLIVAHTAGMLIKVKHAFTTFEMNKNFFLHYHLL